LVWSNKVAVEKCTAMWKMHVATQLLLKKHKKFKRLGTSLFSNFQGSHKESVDHGFQQTFFQGRKNMLFALKTPKKYFSQKVQKT
jgi:hypothetical protein